MAPEVLQPMNKERLKLLRNFLTKDFLSKIGLEGLVIGAMTMISFLTGYNQNGTLLGSTCGKRVNRQINIAACVSLSATGSSIFPKLLILWNQIC